MARLIKRYENRKLYDTEASAYVTHRDIARLVRDGYTVQVIDNVSGEDITARILTQIILEQGKRGDALIPTDLLHTLLRRGSEAAASSLGQLKHSVDELVQHSLSQIGRLVGSPQAEEMDQLREQLHHLEAQLSRVLRAIEEDVDVAEEKRKPAENGSSSAQPPTNL